MLPTAQARSSPLGAVLAPVTLVLAGLAAYLPGFSGPFLFDDEKAILDNPGVRHLWPLGPVLLPPVSGGLTPAGRPLVNLSLAVNYAWGGPGVRGYHVFNLLIHLLAGLALFGIVRRTARGRAEPATLFAWAVALWWLLHPLQTESVTYVVQRAESLMGLFYLLTLYCFIRYAEADETPARSATFGRKRFSGCGGRSAQREDGERTRVPKGCVPRVPTWASEGTTRKRLVFYWAAASIACCLLGMATKEVMVTAPIVICLYDRTFLSGTFREAWRRHRAVLVGLGATWIVLGCLVVQSRGRGGSAGFGHGIGAWTYALTQCRALVFYLRLAVWPHPLVLDYGAGVAPSLLSVWPSAVSVAVLLAGTVWSLVRRPALGFIAAWFFLILAPSSSFVPVVTQTMAEHRLYLSLAAVAVLLALGLRGIAGKPGLILLAGSAVVLGALTFRRNEEYRQPVAIWRDAVAWNPENSRARESLGRALADSGRPAEAEAEYRRALQESPDYAEAHFNLGRCLVALHRPAEAISELEMALRLDPKLAEAHLNLGSIRLEAGDLSAAAAEFREALRLKPDYAKAENNLGNALARSGRYQEKVCSICRALRLQPNDPDILLNQGNVFFLEGRLESAIARYRESLRLRPGYPSATRNLALAEKAQAAAKR